MTIKETPSTEKEILDYLHRIVHATEAVNRHLIALRERVEFVRDETDREGRVQPK